MKTIEHLFPSIMFQCPNKRLKCVNRWKKACLWHANKNNLKTHQKIIEMGRNNDYWQLIYWIMSTFQIITN